MNGQIGDGSGTLRGMSLGAVLAMHGALTEYMECVEPSGRVTLFGRVLLLFHPQEPMIAM